MSGKRIVVETEERICNCSDPTYCQGTRTVRRVLTEGQYVLVEKEDGEWPECVEYVDWALYECESTADLLDALSDHMSDLSVVCEEEPSRQLNERLCTVHGHLGGTSPESWVRCLWKEWGDELGIDYGPCDMTDVTITFAVDQVDALSDHTEGTP